MLAQWRRIRHAQGRDTGASANNLLGTVRDPGRQEKVCFARALAPASQLPFPLRGHLRALGSRLIVDRSPMRFLDVGFHFSMIVP